MNKQVLIVSYEGTVRINNVPNTVKREKLIDMARELLMGIANKPITQLNNIQYLTNTKMYEWIEKHYCKDEFPTYTAVVDYEELGWMK